MKSGGMIPPPGRYREPLPGLVVDVEIMARKPAGTKHAGVIGPKGYEYAAVSRITALEAIDGVEADARRHYRPNGEAGISAS